MNFISFASWPQLPRRVELQFCPVETTVREIYAKLFDYCAAEEFAGWDPFDGLNSPFFSRTPLRFLAPARLVWLQLVKRSAHNLRPLLRVPKGVNAKGIALFALAEMACFRTFGDVVHQENARKLLSQLDGLKFQLTGGKFAYGYNFDWQSRAFFAPKGTPTIVPTAFAAQAFFEADEVFGDTRYKSITDGIAEFICHDLNRVDATDDELSFSYTPIDRSIIFNASLLAAEVLAKVGVVNQRDDFLDLARRAAVYVVRRQRADGAWAYGSKRRHAWVDNFHTAYILLSLFRLQKLIPGFSCDETIRRGFDYWLDNFFLPDGTPKYFDRETYPVDIHSASAAIAALTELAGFDQRGLDVARQVTRWTITNLRDEAGYFYYQKRRNDVVKTPFIRWSQAWTAYALARFMEAERN